MATKLGRSTLPPNHTREDFECFGPVATRDTEFSGCKLADMGCFKQDEGSDSNKFYHAAAVRSKKDGKWYLYVEYGRTKDGAAVSPQFQFTPCDSESEAQAEFISQCDAKNTKRGQWQKVGSKDRYVPRVKKDGSTEDLYVVRYMASRAVGLPSAKNICNADAALVSTTPKKAIAKSGGRSVDQHTVKLFRDLIGGAINYTRTTMVGGMLPALSAIEDARELLQDAMACVKRVGSKVDDQVKDSELKRLTYTLYGMVPKAKAQGAAEDTWILSQDNILAWQQDLDAFETALKSTEVEESDGDDVMAGIPADVEWIDPKSELGKWITGWWAACTRSRHGHSSLKVHNLWRVNRHGDESVFSKNVVGTLEEMPKSWNNERPMFYDKQKQRPDLTVAQRKQMWESNTALLFHGTKSTCVPGIIRENFRFPKELVGVVITGSLYGPGSYYADDWGKSANYCSVGSHGRSMYAGSQGHVPGRHSFMFGCDVILGNPHVANGPCGYTKPPDPHHSVFGKGGGYVQHNEWIVYRKGRCMIRYLAEISF